MLRLTSRTAFQRPAIRFAFIVAMAWLATECTASADEDFLYQQEFSTDVNYIVAKGPNDNNISSISFGNGSQATDVPSVTYEEFAGTGQYSQEVKKPGSIRDGKFSVGSNDRVYDKSRNRTYMTFIDMSKAKVGQYNISFDVTDFQSNDDQTAIYLHVYEGELAHRGYLDFQLTQQTMLPKMVSNAPLIQGHGGHVADILLDNEITADGKFSLNFGISDAGAEGNYIALAWSQVKRGGDAPMPSMSIDNIRVKRLTKPSASPTSMAPVVPVGQSGVWKFRGDVSDEFNEDQVDPAKWNSNPKSYGALSWDDSKAVQKDGKLHLNLEHESHTRSNQKLFYKSGMLRSHQQVTYGYYEAKIKGCSLFPGACPAFWVFSDGRKYDGEVRYCEIDFAELQMNELDHETQKRNSIHHIDMNLHHRIADKDGKLQWVRANTHPEICKTAWVAPWDPRDDFHIYGCDVTPEKITWFIDGKEVGSKPNKYCHLPMNVALTLELRHPHIGWQGYTIFPVPKAATEDGFPTSMEVDYVRVWTRE